jgi:hypothetical protein
MRKFFLAFESSHTRYMRRLRQARRAEQMCVDCGRDINRFTRCLACRIRQRGYARAYKAKRTTSQSKP